MFRIGTLVFLTNTALQDEIGIGTVLNVIRSDSDLPDFTLYDVDFASGLPTLQGSELRPVPISISSCGEKEQPVGYPQEGVRHLFARSARTG